MSQEPQAEQALLSHINEEGQAVMVNIAQKAVTARQAWAKGYLLLPQEAFQALKDNSIPKGDVIATARIAGIMAAKQTHESIPLCHPLKVVHVSIDFKLFAWAELSQELRLSQAFENGGALEVTSHVGALDRTGVEMEALHAASVTLLSAYDMLKALNKGMVITGLYLDRKEGGRSGDYRASGLLT